MGFSTIVIYNSILSSLVVVDKFLSLDAYFGSDLPDNGLFGRISLASPIEACDAPIKPAPAPYRLQNETVLPIALISRGTCSFLDKIQAATEAGFAAAIVFTLPDDPPTGMGPTGYPEFIPAGMKRITTSKVLILLLIRPYSYDDKIVPFEKDSRAKKINFLIDSPI